MKNYIDDLMCKKQIVDNQIACTAGTEMVDKMAKEKKRTKKKEYMKEYRKK